MNLMRIATLASVLIAAPAVSAAGGAQAKIGAGTWGEKEAGGAK
jgi:hypothetical protein